MNESITKKLSYYLKQAEKAKACRHELNKIKKLRTLRRALKNKQAPTGVFGMLLTYYEDAG